MTQIRVFADHVVESSEITTGITIIGDYELHDLFFRVSVLFKCTVIVPRSFLLLTCTRQPIFSNLSFGVIIRVEAEAFQVIILF